VVGGSTAAADHDDARADTFADGPTADPQLPPEIEFIELGNLNGRGATIDSRTSASLRNGAVTLPGYGHASS